MKNKPSSEKASIIINGRAFTEDDVYLFTDLPEDQQLIVRSWIAKNIKSSINENESSVSLRQKIEQATGIVLTNNQVKDAMLLSGYRPVDSRRMNWHYETLPGGHFFKGCGSEGGEPT